MGFLILLGLVMIGLDVYAAFLFGEAVEEKGYEDKKTAVILLAIFLPPAGYLLACALPDKSLRAFDAAVPEVKQSSFSDDELPSL